MTGWLPVWAAALVTAFGWAAPAVAQPLDDGGPRVWIAGGLGLGTQSDSGSGGAAMAQVVLKTGPHLVRARASVVFEIFNDASFDVGLLYGRGVFGPASHASLSAGLAIVQFEDCGGLFGGPCRSETTVGVPLVAEASWRAATFLGLGVQGFATVSASNSAFGAVVFAEIGSLR